MTTVAQISGAVKRLPRKDLVRFRKWFAECDAAVWNRQLEADVAAGKLDLLIRGAQCDLSRAGKLELVVTARIREDVPDPPLSASIDGLGELSIQEGPSVTRVGVWALGRGVLGSDQFVDLSEKVSSMLQSQGKTPPDWRDWDHLHAHYLSGRDVFLTWDRRILDCGPELKRRLDLVVMRPEQYVDSMGA